MHTGMGRAMDRRSSFAVTQEGRASFAFPTVRLRYTAKNWKFRMVKIFSASSRAIISFWFKWLSSSECKNQSLIAVWACSAVGIPEQELSRFPFSELVWGEVSQNHLYMSFFLPVSRTYLPGGWWQQCVPQPTAVAYSGRGSKAECWVCKMR